MSYVAFLKSGAYKTMKILRVLMMDVFLVTFRCRLKLLLVTNAFKAMG